MRVQHSLDVRPSLVDRAVERVLDGWFVDALHRSVGLHTHNIFTGQRTLVDAAGRDPQIAVFAQHREVAAGGCGHTVGIDAFHDHYDLIRGVQ
jgi:hypothetical protein